MNPAAAAPPTRRYIRDLRPSERVRGMYTLANAQLGRTRSDKPYLRCLVGDKTGDMAGRMWTVDERLMERLSTDCFVYLEGETQAYQGEMQLIIQNLEPVEPTTEQLRDLIPCSKRDPEEMFGELVAILDTLQHPAMKALAGAYLSDAMLMSAFKQCPAAKSMHHAYLGGLLEHTLQLLMLGSLVTPLYPKVNRDLVLMGLFLHDLGKTRELAYDRVFGYTDRGELIGHIVEGVIMLRDKAHQVVRESGQRMPPGSVLVLEHIILSHHGQPEFGSPKHPATPEAILVSMLDNLDAKTTMACCAARPDHLKGVALGGNFTEKQWALDNARLFRPDPLK